MAQPHDGIEPRLQEWIERQRIFFVATAPLAADGSINCSPKGMDSFRVLGPRDVAYIDLTGSGAETIAHLRENGRIVFMFCAFDGPPQIVRLHGRGEAMLAGSSAYDELRSLFPEYPGNRAIIRAAIHRVSDSCGYAVPRFDFREQRDALTKWSEKKGEDALAVYRREKNAVSLDGLPAITPSC